MSVKKFLAALAFSAVAAFTWLGVSPAAAAAAPTSQVKTIGQKLGEHAKKKHKKKKHHKKGAASVSGVQNSSGGASAKSGKSGKGGKKHRKHHKKHKKS